MSKWFGNYPRASVPVSGPVRPKTMPKLLLTIAAAAAAVSSAASAPKVSVSVFEEALCPACIGFFSFNPVSPALNPACAASLNILLHINLTTHNPFCATQNGVWGAYQAVGDIMDLTMVYWGNAQGPASKPTCQHGPVECAGNLILECAIGLNNQTNKSLPYISCIDETLVKTFPAGLPPGTVNMTFLESTAQGCATKTGLDWSKIDACRSGPQGTSFIQYAKDATPDHDAVPFSVIDGKQSVPPPQDLIQAVCDAYTGMDKPAACSSGARKTGRGATYKSKCVKEEY